MFRKNLLLASFLLIGGVLTSCNNFSSAKIYNLRVEGLDSYVALSAEELSFHLAAKDDFALMVSQKSCLGCRQAKTYLKSYVAATHNIIYDIDYADYSEIQAVQKELPTIKKTPTFLFFRAGEVLKMVEGVSNDIEGFKALFDKYLTDNEVYSLNTFEKVPGNGDYWYTENKADLSVLQKKIADSEDLTVFYTWLRCGDCQNFHRQMFDEYVTKLDKSIKVYQFEVDYFRKDKPALKPDETDESYADYQKWYNFADEMGFASYRDGKVPVLVNYRSGEFSEMAVFANDGEIQKDENGNYYYGLTFYDEIQNIRADSEKTLQKKAQQRELELVREFMDRHLKGEIYA